MKRKGYEWLVTNGDAEAVDFDALQRRLVRELRRMCQHAVEGWYEDATGLQLALASNRGGEQMLNADAAERRVRRELEYHIPNLRDDLKAIEQLQQITGNRPPDAVERVGRLLGRINNPPHPPRGRS